MSYRILFFCISHIGKCRKINQDNFICDGRYMELVNDNTEFPLHGSVLAKARSVFGVFDGMGGEECGEVASYIAAKVASTIVWEKDVAFELKEHCMITNEEICKYIKNNFISSMGTTAALLAFTNKEIVLCNIGDSKIFRFSENVLEQISKDHLAISVFGKKPPLTQNLGIPPTELVIEPYIARGQYNDGDIYMICSDGLTDKCMAALL